MVRTILVVEDADLLRRMYTDRLTRDGYHVLVANNGIEALSTLRSNTPDLILLDLVMPQMSGLEVLDVVQRDPRLSAIPVVVLSNLGQDADIRRGIEMGAADYLVKNDARPADVSEKISSILSQAAEHAKAVQTYRLILRDHEADADRFADDAALTRRFWCPVCEVELNLELQKTPDRPGWYSAHVVCPVCGRQY